jgi:hypothetical protein
MEVDEGSNPTRELVDVADVGRMSGSMVPGRDADSRSEGKRKAISTQFSPIQSNPNANFESRKMREKDRGRMEQEKFMLEIMRGRST